MRREKLPPPPPPPTSNRFPPNDNHIILANQVMNMNISEMVNHSYSKQQQHDDIEPIMKELQLVELKKTEHIPDIR